MTRGLLADKDGELIKTVVVQDRDVPGVALHAVVEETAWVPVVEVRPFPLGIRIRGQAVERESAPAGAMEQADDGIHVLEPLGLRNIEFDIEQAACDRVVALAQSRLGAQERWARLAPGHVAR